LYIIYFLYIRVMKTGNDYSINEIAEQFKDVISRDELFALMLKLKQSSEFGMLTNWPLLLSTLGTVYNIDRPFYVAKEYTLENMGPHYFIDSNNIFCFGSNTEGRHDGGAALFAEDNLGAIYGQARGLQGNSYAIVTIDYTGNNSVTLDTIAEEINELFKFALENPQLKFYVTKIGTGISKYNILDIANLFKNKIIPTNIILPIEFVNSDNITRFRFL